MKTMEAIVLHEHGNVDQLKYEKKVPIENLKDDEIRVEVNYCGVNHVDIWLRKGNTGDKLTLPRIPGSDVVGVVNEIGANVDNVKVGDTVVLYPGKGCESCPDCIEGRETLCRYFEVLG